VTCTVEKRERLRDLAATLRSHPRVAGVDVLAPATGPRDAWTLEAVLDTGTCPPAVLRALGNARVHVVEARPRGSGFHVVARV
jgi:hypothetical protein